MLFEWAAVAVVSRHPTIPAETLLRFFDTASELLATDCFEQFRRIVGIRVVNLDVIVLDTESASYFHGYY